MEEDKRKLERVLACLFVSVSPQKGSGVQGIISDLSLGGFKLSSENAVRTGELYALKVENPYVNKGPAYENFSARALWSASHNDVITETGFVFHELSTSASALFARLEGDFRSHSQALEEINLDEYIVSDELLTP